MKLFHVQDADRPMYVVARDWTHAVERWTSQICEENECDDAEQPSGVTLLAEVGGDFPEFLEREEAADG